MTENVNGGGKKIRFGFEWRAGGMSFFIQMI
jgi:hypothetical protein